MRRPQCFSTNTPQPELWCSRSPCRLPLVGSNRILTGSGTATSEGLLTLSSNGQYLVLAGYDAAVGTAGVANTASAAVNRVIGRVDAAATIDTTTALTDAYSGTAGTAGNPRGAVSTDGMNFWTIWKRRYRCERWQPLHDSWIDNVPSVEQRPKPISARLISSEGSFMFLRDSLPFDSALSEPGRQRLLARQSRVFQGFLLQLGAIR